MTSGLSIGNALPPGDDDTWSSALGDSCSRDYDHFDVALYLYMHLFDCDVLLLFVLL